MKPKVKQKRNLPVAGTLGNPDQFRERLIEACGLTLDKQAHLVNKAVEKLEEDLEATKTLVTMNREGMIDRTVCPDNQARAKARDQVFALTGALAPKTNISTTVRQVIEIEWPEFMRPQAIVDAESVKALPVVAQDVVPIDDKDTAHS